MALHKQRNKKRIYYVGQCLLCIFLFIFQVVQAGTSYLVAPGKVDFDLSHPTTQSFIINNNGDSTIRLRIKPIYFPIDSKSVGLGTHLNPETRAIEDLTQYIRVSPKALILRPGQRRDIRVAIRAPIDAQPGDYRSHLLVAMVETDKVKKKEKESEKMSMQLNIKFETAVAILGRKGTRIPSLVINCVRHPDYKELILEINNPTVWRFEGTLAMSSEKQKTPLFKRRIISLRESRQYLLTNVTDEKGLVSLHWQTLGNEISGQTACSL